MESAASSGMPLSCNAAIMAARTSPISMYALPLIKAEAAVTTCWATSKIAMVISKVWETRKTATHILMKYLKKLKVSPS